MKFEVSKRVYYLFGIFILIIAALIPSLYFYNQYRKTQALLLNPTQASKEELKNTITKVATLMELPEGEEPTMATVSDINKLKDQPFFAHAKNGDKILIYTNAKKAILYDPVSNKIVDVAPVAIGTGSASPSLSPSANTPTPKPTLKIPTPTKE